MSPRDLLAPPPATAIGVSEDAKAYVGARYARPEWAMGTISRADAAFLFDMLMRERPAIVAEIGVASGTSTAFLSTLLGDRLPGSRLFAFDALETVYNRPEKPVGAYVSDLFGRVPANLVLKPGMASIAIRDWPDRPERLDLVFLDANHEHPWPCLDILSILDVVAPRAWIVLHDTGLPVNTLEAKSFGPLYLLQTWPGEKRAPAANDANIAAIRLFENPAETMRALIRCMNLPWHARPPKEAWRSALGAAAEKNADPEDALAALIDEPKLAKRVSMRGLQVAIRGPNPWSQITPDLVSNPLVLHANLPDEPVASITVSGLDTGTCQGLIAPSIVRSGEGTVPLRASLSLRSREGFEGPSVEFTLRDSDPRAAYLLVPDLFGDAFELEIKVAFAEKTTALHGGWVKFKMLHFV